MRRLLLVMLVALPALGLVGFFGVAPLVADRQMNVRLQPPPYAVPLAAAALHGALRVADLHADALLWGRDLTDRASHGHVDVPRLLDGGVTVQVFAAVTKTPKGINYERNSDRTDNITLLARAQRWPTAAVHSLLARARFLAARLRETAAASDGRLVVVTSRRELDAVLAGGPGAPRRVAGLLATEGLHPLEGRLDALDTLFAEGYRMVGLTHFFDNEVAGSAHGERQGGLTPLGRQVVARAEALGMLVDVAHASPQTVEEVVAMSTRPVVVSHTGVQGTCPGPRNLSDAQLRRIAATGGVIGIGFWEAAVCGTTPAHIARAIRHAVQVVGVAHVALGSDWDGATTIQFDAGGVALVTAALLEAGLSREEIAQVMGENTIRLLRAALPPG